jgi:hypothetical protein
MSGDTKEEQVTVVTSPKTKWRAAKSVASKTGRLIGLRKSPSKATTAAAAAKPIPIDVTAAVSATIAKEDEEIIVKQKEWIGTDYISMILAYCTAGTLFTIEFVRAALGHPPSQMQATITEEQEQQQQNDPVTASETTRRQRSASSVPLGSASACCAIWKESHLYNTWFPFCNFSGKALLSLSLLLPLALSFSISLYLSRLLSLAISLLLSLARLLSLLYPLLTLSSSSSSLSIISPGYLKKYSETDFVVHFGGTTPVGRNDFVVHGCVMLLPLALSLACYLSLTISRLLACYLSFILCSHHLCLALYLSLYLYLSLPLSLSLSCRYGVNNLEESGKFFIIGNSPPLGAREYDGAAVPKPKFLCQRFFINGLSHPSSTTSRARS